jgi:GT2 family glycosyltransferase
VVERRADVSGHAIAGNRWDALDGLVPDPFPRVSVIVAHYRQPEQLARTLQALRAQDYPADLLEVIVADDGSPEPPVVPADVAVVAHADVGFRLAAVRNLGVGRSTGDILVFLDADTSPEPAFVRELTRLPALSYDVVTVGRRRHADLAGSPSLEAALDRELPEPAWLRDAYARSRNLLDADDRSYRYVIGAVLSCSRRFFAEVGGFDESFTAYGGEDWEWTYRAWIRGAVLAHVPGAVAWHDGPDAGVRDRDRQVRNAEAIRLADLIPAPGSRGHGRRAGRIDVVVHPPSGEDPGRCFISLDSVLAALPGAEAPPAAGDLERSDRVRVRVDILHPVRATGSALSDLVARLAAEGLGEIMVTDDDGTDLVRIVSTRAQARAARWERSDLFPTVRVSTSDLTILPDEVDVAAYLGGWA